jgi:DNA-binding Lrp family transcriptional regulator
MPAKLNSLDSLDIKIIKALETYGPRNITQIAKALDASIDTVRFRMKRMSSLFRLRMSASVYHTNLGLKKVVIFAEATPGHEDLLFECLKINTFYVYLTRCYGMFEGCFVVYTIPVDHYTELMRFIQEIENLGVAKNIQSFCSTCFHTVNRTSTWFDDKSEQQAFQWDKWIKEVPIQPTNLPYTLIDPENFPMRADALDLLIIKHLEVDATISLKKIAENLKTSPQRIRYRYRKHLIGRGLIEKYQITIRPFDRSSSSLLWFIFKFDSSEKMARFASSLLDKPFSGVLGKILNENALVAQIYLPNLELRQFIDRLSQLCRDNWLQGYNYIIQDRRKGRWSRETIPFEDSKDGKWIYNHNKHIKDLRRLVKQQIA